MSVTAILRQRRDTAANWTSANPTPEAGQLCFETDTLKAKLGDGATAWTSLAYLPPGLTDGDKGDVTVSGTGATWTIDAGVVTLAKMANLATDRLIGRATAGTGAPESIPCTAAGRALLDDADAAAQRATLGLSGAEIEVDFGSASAFSKSWTITDAAVTGTSKILVSASGAPATGGSADDGEWDAITYTAQAGSGSFVLRAIALPGPVRGRRKLNYLVTG